MSYDNWRARLEIAEKYKTVAERRAAVSALKINFSQPGEADEGYYRKPITEKDPSGNGLNIIKGWIPVAYFIAHHGGGNDIRDKLCGIIGAGDEARDMTDEEVGDEQLWSYVVSHPISYELYQGVVEHGDVWPDLRNSGSVKPFDLDFKGHCQTCGGDGHINKHENLPDEPCPACNPAAVREINRDHNKPPELLPHVEHGNAIDNAIGAAKDLPVTTVAEAALAAGAANLIRDRRLAAEKVGKSKVDPLKLAYETERNNWLPKIKEAKDAEDAIRKQVSDFEAAERKRIAKEQADAATKLREQEEAAQRVADRAIAAGVPEQPPEINEEVVIPQAPQPVQPTYGSYRPAAKPLKKFAVISNQNLVYQYFQSNKEVVDLLQKLATNAIRAGTKVPGSTFREGTE